MINSNFVSFQGGLIYEAKVQALLKEDGTTRYRIHYKVEFMDETKETLFKKDDYGTASPEYHRRAL